MYPHLVVDVRTGKVLVETFDPDFAQYCAEYDSENRTVLDPFGKQV